MDSTADTPSGTARHTPITRRLVVAVAGLFVLGVLVAIAALLNIAQKLDAEDVRKTHFYIERALENRITASKNYIASYAYWTTAYDHLNGEVDVQWAYAEQNMGKTLFTNDEYEGVFVIDRQRTKYAVVRGRNVQDDASVYMDTPLPALVDQLQTQPDLTMSTIRYTLFEGWPAVVTASVILPNDERPQVEAKGTSVLLFVDQLTPVKLRKMGKSYGLTDLNLKKDTELEPGQPAVPLDSTGYSLVSRLERPGQHLLWSLVPPLGGALLILALLTAYFFRYAMRTARHVDASYDSLEKSAHALEASEERFRAVAEAASDWIWEIDGQQRITYLSGRFNTVTGFSDQQWLGQDIEQLLYCDTTPIALWLGKLTEEQNASNLRCSYRDHSGQLRFCRVSARPIYTKGEVVGYRGTASDITDEVAAHAQVQHLSMHDALTGLPNRNKLARYLDDALVAKEHAAPLTLLMVDLDNFKPINDSLGHPAGDAVLLEVAQRLRDSTREQDLVARLGGDEFVVVLNGMEHTTEIDRFCERLIDSLQQPILYETHSLHIGASIGIAVSRRQGYVPGELIRCADIALYQAKSEGKKTWCYFASQMNDQIQHRRQLESDLRQAVKKNEFVLHFQPRYTVDGREIVAVEALVRWQHPTQGLLGPDAFIPLAEQTDLIVPLSRWVLREACETALTWPGELMVSVNLSPAQFERSDVVEDVRQVLIETRFPASRLELEITENVMLNDVDGALQVMNALKELGVRLNMDDFGTGYSSLGYLRTYPFDGIKIDKRFIASMSNSSNDRAVVQAIINLGKAMGLTVTAEGVETLAQLGSLGSDQCHEVQGYFLSRPIDKQAFAQLLENGRPLTKTGS
ncbi:EAL domain-containing protein [Pseudomonas thivervalensis]|uniref:Bifunctional diguanylate cyclase/phosphodiesterase n=1 Tax=Pseudomonas thivervalensis TaxID=86265 RepID=A0A176NGD3_9PSED|nr:EAL domain-containing protein [Pseudomonas thivervalensis]AXA54684.1 bifunctional diguanylate cyclase/phosphodiesterase [Pseudomonas thivervalensis]AXA60364.1 bifunctional diguanylate cyclase/phosphodiesterase [Pseudomonas thivervalensis]OAB50165.1 histidine kinase [Pseudomonas thivervalensis]SDF85223.1 PAS domain S-box-containing protein/diguanylate cyclase (GGDEF) domain-containing protein [Pseudomonas thivervalensis]